MIVYNPVWLIAFILIPLYFLVGKRQSWRMDVSQKWLILSLVFIIVALARPIIPQKPTTVEEAGQDVILALDLSYSMRGTDVAPSRLEAAKKILIETVRSHPHDRFGVIGFTTSAIVLSPLTKDTQLLEHLFGALDETQIITKGTSVMGALELSRQMSQAHHPLVILLTDGGDEVSYQKEAQFAVEYNLRVNIVMLASRNGSTLLVEGGNTLKDENGHIVVSASNDAIREIAKATEGKVVEDVGGLRDVINKSRIDDFSGNGSVSDNKELFLYPLSLALIAFVLAMTTLGESISRKIMVILAFIGLSANAGVLDFTYLYWASNHYHQKNYEESAHWYGRVESKEAHYNRGNALYKGGKYQDALMQYQQIQSNNPKFKSQLYYNMGNCFVRLGEFENGRNAFLKSLTLHYTKEADENLRFIAEVKEKKSLNVRKEKKDQFSKDENAPTGEKKEAKSGGGSNMKSDMASGGGGDEGKKVESDPRLSMSQGKAKLSSRQYELINARSVHETKPW
ncbi:MAG: VWA domain-containing protein [Campylobacterales bacterium]|nr:VWA domain-containing protein [Campylobacterales bacterium]